MKKEKFWRNPSTKMALLGGLAAAITVFTFLSAGSSTVRQTGAPSGKEPAIQSETQTKKSAPSQKQVSSESRILMALRIADYEILRSRLKKGVRVTVFWGYEQNRNQEEKDKMVLENVLIAEVPLNSATRLPSREQGILIEATKEEAEQLARLADTEPLRIVIQKD
jgi:hypothetical protein